MEERDKKEFAMAMGVVRQGLGIEITKNNMRFLFSFLGEFSIDQVKDGISRLMKEYRFRTFPTPADFYRYVNGSATEIAQIQAESVLTAIKQHGAYSTMLFDDPITMRVLSRFGGWVATCLSVKEEFAHIFVRDFIEAYKSMSAMGAKRCLPLYGIDKERQKVPVMIGDPGKCQALLESCESAPHQLVDDLAGALNMNKETKSDE